MEFKKIAKDSMIPLKTALRVSGKISVTDRLLFGTGFETQEFLYLGAINPAAAGTDLALIDFLRGRYLDSSTIVINIGLDTTKSLRRNSEFRRNDETKIISMIASANALTSFNPSKIRR